MAAQNTSTTEPRIDIGNPYTPRRPAPIVSISVNHPLAQAARKIKNFLVHKQTLFSTTFSIKVTPIVAMVSLFGVAALFSGGVTTAYNFGKTVESKFLASVPSPTPKVIIQAPSIVVLAKSGIIKATYQLPIVNPSIIEGFNSNNEIATPASGQTRNDNGIPTPTPLPVLHYILISRSGSIIFLSFPSTLHMQNYLNLRVLITGSFDSMKNTMTITKPADIEVLQ